MPTSRTRVLSGVRRRRSPRTTRHSGAWRARRWCGTVRARVEELLPLKNLPPEVLSVTANVSEPGRLADLIAANLRLRLAEAQELLEIANPLRAAAPGGRVAAARGRRHRGPARSSPRRRTRSSARSTRALPARAIARDPGRARRKRPAHRGGRGVPREGRGGGAARGGTRRGHAPAAPPGAHAPRWAGGARGAHLPRTGWSSCLGRRLRSTASISPTRVRSSTRTTRTSTRSRTASSNTWACASCARTRAARSCASSVRPAWARPRSAARSRARWAGSSCGSRSAACGTRRRSAATGGPMSARSPAASSRVSGRRAPTTPSSCSTRSTSWGRTSAAILLQPCSRCWIPSRTRASAITI